MSEASNVSPHRHSHVFLGEGHDKSERKTWAVIWLCGAMMLAEIGGGLMFGSIALVADGMHMSTHAGALLLAALAYSYARKHADDPRFTFGTGKFGDLAGFTSAIILAMIALLIGYESVRITTQEGVVTLEIFEDGAPPRFRLHSETGPSLAAHSTVIETMRQEG